ncbi:ABC transporter ATP-binding protein [Aurantimonas sp. MSK8Z-1]|uniref:ABC transporter ATP-binding protein n=1 Tax=Mangrovibrevibacter kandeliae TaxID=2968473 RepID=UPI002117DB04|nr:ABC transporter ATP-binding protein [Aurantimonas sp. MSK8Z-1]MCW4115477.1 ABC transporter ATP-binding protein [Aurantimonas sp. MSK8Z-1]
MSLSALEYGGAGATGAVAHLGGATAALAAHRNPALQPVLEIEGLTVGTDRVDLVLDVSLRVAPGETLCLVGESGCGKSLTCLAAMGLLAAPVRRKAGSVRLSGVELSGLGERRLRQVRGRDMAMIFQDPVASLNPVQRVGQQVAEALRVHEALSQKAASRRAVELFDKVGIAEPARRADAYPHELSGGMCQRVMIAMALACRPRLIVADEATTALDVTTQAQILRLMKALQEEIGTAMVFVTHDLGVVAEIADSVAVMYSGRIVETGSVDGVFDAPAHPYTQGLMDCRLHALAAAGGRLAAISGSVPRPAERPSGCAFRTRCPRASSPCERLPMLAPFGASQRVACHFPGRAT